MVSLSPIQDPFLPLFTPFQVHQLCALFSLLRGFPGGASGKKTLACQCRRHEIQVRPLGQEEPLEEGMAILSSILAWKISRTEELVGYSPQPRKECGMTEVT